MIYSTEANEGRFVDSSINQNFDYFESLLLEIAIRLSDKALAFFFLISNVNELNHGIDFQFNKVLKSSRPTAVGRPIDWQGWTVCEFFPCCDVKWKM